MGFVYDLKDMRGEEFLWRQMSLRDLAGDWTIAEIDGASRAGDRAPHEYLRRLLRGGFVVSTGTRAATPPSKTPAKLYRIAKPRQAAPRLRRDGRELPERVIDTLWRTMKMLKRFTPEQLALHASSDKREIKASTAERYARELAAVNLLTRIKGRTPQYSLIVNLGASAPRVLRRHVVFDPNALVVIGEAKRAEEAFE